MKLLESVEVNTRDKAERIIDTLKKQGRNAHYMEFFVGDIRYKNYLVFYWTLKGERL